MAIQQEKEQLLSKFSQQVLACLQGKISHTELSQFAKELTAKREVYNDIRILRCIALVDFIGENISNTAITTKSYHYIMKHLHTK